MRTQSTMIDDAALAKLERKHLEADWRRAWESCSHAAQAGDYAEAERWHQRALLLGSQLAVVTHAIGALHQEAASV
ncbi:MAG: hypothetical protein U0841_00935 [Chloroflexia bacterium]